MRRRPIIVAVLILLAAIISWPVLLHYRLKHKVAEYRRQLAAQGEKMTIAELTPLLPPDRDNGAGNLMFAASQAGSINYTNQPPSMRIVVPGRAMVAWRQPVLPNSDSTNVWPSLRQDVEARGEVLLEMRTALERPAFSYNLDFSQGFNLLLPHLSDCKRAAQWLSAATVFDLHEGRVTNAVDNLQTMTTLISRYKDEPMIISSLVRIVIAAITVNAIWEALQSPDWNDKQLAGLQAAWEKVDFLTQAEAALSMERAMSEGTLAEMRTSPRAAAAVTNPMGGGRSSSGLKEFLELGQEVLNDPGKGFKDLFQRYPAYWAWKWWWSYEDELVQMQHVQAALTALREVRSDRCFAPALDRCNDTKKKIQEGHPKAGSWFNLGIGAFAETYLTRVRAIEIQRHLLVTAIALKRFQLRYGHYPDALTELLPEFCRESPRDPVDGQPLRYRRQDDGSFLLYSVGENGVDNGGDPSPPEAHKTPRHWLKALDVVWPQPASAQETMLYELESEGERDKQQLRLCVVVTNGLSPAVLTQLERLAKNYRFTLTNQAGAKP